MSKFFVEREPRDVAVWGQQERCCFCRAATTFWTLHPDPCKVTGKSVACCEACAERGHREDLPTKEQWMRRERIADHSYAAQHQKPIPPPKNTRSVR